MRDNPVAATAAGVSLVRIKMLAFVVSAAMAGLAGALFAVQKTVVTPDDFTADFSIFFLLVVVLGGAGRLWGPVIGAIVFFLVPELLAALQSWRMLIYGIALLLLMLYAPHGLVGAIEVGLEASAQRGSALPVPPEPLAAASREPVEPVAGATLSVQGVEKRFGGVAALAGVSLDVAAGATHAIVGPNGSGKTTLLNMISGFYPVDAGTILVDGRSVIGLAPHRIAAPRRRPHLPDAAHAAATERARQRAARRLSRPSARARCRRRCACRSARREQAASLGDALRYLDFVGLADRAREPAGELPHGQQRLAEIARALVGRPRLLLLDEPAAGLSLAELDRLGELIAAIGRARHDGGDRRASSRAGRQYLLQRHRAGARRGAGLGHAGRGVLARGGDRGLHGIAGRVGQAAS